eukprot:scaffold5110_cov122-Isochrysis_galbana.AAC.2
MAPGAHAAAAMARTCAFRRDCGRGVQAQAQSVSRGEQGGERGSSLNPPLTSDEQTPAHGRRAAALALVSWYALR